MPENLRRSFGLWERHEAMSVLLGLLISALLAALSALGIYKAISGFTFLSYLGLGLLSWFLWLVLVITPVKMWRSERERADNLEESKKPCLEIGSIFVQSGKNDPSLEWVLEVRNKGTEVAEDCYALLEQITTEESSTKLEEMPRNKSLHWSGHLDNIEHFQIGGGQSGMLGILYWGTDGESLITLPYRQIQSNELRLRYALTVREPVLLYLNITSKDRKPLFVTIRINLQDLKWSKIRELDGNSIYKIIWSDTRRYGE